MPHPFDRLHDVPGLALLREMLDEIDVMEVFNSRIALRRSTNGPSASRPATGSPPPPAATAHVLPGIGTALTGMAEFEGPDDFVAALADSHIIRRRKSLLYLHSLKFLQTSFDGQSRD